MPSSQEGSRTEIRYASLYMIAFLRGHLLIKTPQYTVIDVHGVGYKVFIPLSTFPKLPSHQEEVTLHTYTNVREDAIQLYGFLSTEERDFFITEERDFFIMLLTISGIGPKMGLNIMSGPSLSDLMEIVDQGDVKRLSMIPGVGKKTAARIVLELKEKLVPLSSLDEKRGIDTKIATDALSALMNLGYPRVQAHEAIRVAGEVFQEMSLEELLREALKKLAKGQG